MIEPALMTYPEYYRLINRSNTWHASSAYDCDIANLNSYAGVKSDHPLLLRRCKIAGLWFEFRLRKEDIWERDIVKTNENGLPMRDATGAVQYLTMDEKAAHKVRRWDYTISVFEGDRRVAFSGDEWGCMLIVVAAEYRGLGIGKILSRLAWELEPGKNSGGFTPDGERSFRSVHRGLVQEKMASGFYSKAVLNGEMSAARAKDIIASAGLPRRPREDLKIDLSSENPKDWLLYVGDFGDFILYDRKLKDLLAVDDERYDYFADRMMKGMMYAAAGEHCCRIKAFGGDSDIIKRMMMQMAVNHAAMENTPLIVEPGDLKWVDREQTEISSESLKAGYRSATVVAKGMPFDIKPMQLEERRFRQSFDRYREFETRLLDMAYSKWQNPGNTNETISSNQPGESVSVR